MNDSIADIEDSVNYFLECHGYTYVDIKHTIEQGCHYVILVYETGGGLDEE